MKNNLLLIVCAMAFSLWNAQPAGAEPRKVSNDFDGDGKTDVAVYYPASGQWWVFLSGSMTVTNVTTQGGTNCLPAPGDYDGDGKTDFMVFDSTTGNWYGKLSDGREGMATFGPGMWPVSADYDGDRATDLGVYDPLTGMWSVYSLTRGWLGGGTWGYLGDFRPWDNPPMYTVLPMPFDYNQDGVDDFGYYYRGMSMEDSGWSIFYAGMGAEYYNWGSSGSLPAPGKYQVKMDAAPYGVCVYKIKAQELVKSAEWDIPYRTAFYMGVYGQTLPVCAGDYDGNGFDDNTVYNYVTGEWTIVYNTGGADVVGREQVSGFFGGAGVVPANLYSTIYKLARYSPKPW
ncbi:MAG: VCBS repeat-containing protein [Kiritimatiellia bacterium]|jgi:hypothetical protein